MLALRPRSHPSCSARRGDTSERTSRGKDGWGAGGGLEGTEGDGERRVGKRALVGLEIRNRISVMIFLLVEIYVHT